jgi:hypothetical protein
MAMTKKEQAAMQAAIDRAELLAALRWTAPVERDVLPPDSSWRAEYTEGWTFNAYTGIVQQEWRASGSQGAQLMYSTQAKALAGLRHEVEREAARKLLAIDRRLAEVSYAY